LPIKSSPEVIRLVVMMYVEGQVTGSGAADINGGTLNFLSTFEEAVDFLGARKLGLSDSQGYTGQVTGFSATGAADLDLADIGFVGVDEAAFSGTVTDGAHTANINLVGNDLSATFVTISDGHGGTDVIDNRGTKHVWRAARR
jgi:hypothetical protein